VSSFLCHGKRDRLVPMCCGEEREYSSQSVSYGVLSARFRSRTDDRIGCMTRTGNTGANVRVFASVIDDHILTKMEFIKELCWAHYSGLDSEEEYRRGRGVGELFCKGMNAPERRRVSSGVDTNGWNRT